MTLYSWLRLPRRRGFRPLRNLVGGCFEKTCAIVHSCDGQRIIPSTQSKFLKPYSPLIYNDAWIRNFMQFFFQGSNIPTSKSKKADYVDFLEERGVEFDPDWTVSMLWDLVKIELEGDAPCLVDDVAAKAGIRIIRLPPYHPEASLNAIITIWFWS